MMARIQVTLDSELHRRARDRAAQLGVSFAQYIRRLVNDDLVEHQRRVSASPVLELGSSGGSDVARDKDQLVGEAVLADHER